MRVFIVDDEPLVRIAFKSLINWSEHGFEIQGEASNGEEALHILKKYPADIVVTDIKMPVMDGIELVKAIKPLFPHTVVVMLSCYDQFELVKKAFTMGAFDYMLKTEMSGEKLLQLFKRVENHLDEQASRTKEQSENKRLVTKNLDKLKEGFFKRLIWNSAYEEQPADLEIKKFGLRLDDRKNYVGIFNIDNIKKAAGIYGDDGLQLLTFSVVNICEEILGEYGIGDIFTNTIEEYISVFSFTENMGRKSERYKLHELCSRVLNSVRKYIGITMSCGISGFTCDGYKALSSLYKQARLAYDYRFSLGKSKVIFYEDIEGLKGKINLNRKEKISLLRNFLCIPDNCKLNEILNRILIKDRNLGREHFNKVKQLYDEYFVILTDHIRRTEYSEDMDFMVQSYYDDIKISGTLEDYNCWFESLFDHICTHKVGEGYLVQRVKRYIMAHYHETIQLKQVSEYMNVSAEHLSREFSKNSGCSFTKYLTRVRIEKTKEYLENTHLNAVEIAGKVGYASADYLSRIFKRETGYTLSGYCERL